MEGGVKACWKPGLGGQARVLVAALGGRSSESWGGQKGTRWWKVLWARGSALVVGRWKAGLGPRSGVGMPAAVRVATRGARGLIHPARVRAKRSAWASPGTPGVPSWGGGLTPVGRWVPTRRPSRAGDASNGYLAPARGSAAECGPTSPCEACGGAAVSEVRASRPGIGVSSRVHVTTSRLQMVGNRHLSRWAGVLRGVELGGIAGSRQVGYLDQADLRGARRGCSGRCAWKRFRFLCRSTSPKGEVEPAEGISGRWSVGS